MKRLHPSYAIAGMIGVVVQQSKTGCRQTEDPQDVQGMVQPGMAMRMQ